MLARPPGWWASEEITNRHVLMTRDVVPTEPKVQELKFSAPGVGMLLRMHTDGAGGRVALVSCTAGSSAHTPAGRTAPLRTGAVRRLPRAWIDPPDGASALNVMIERRHRAHTGAFGGGDEVCVLKVDPVEFVHRNCPQQ